MDPEEILEIIREDQRQQDKTIAEIKEKASPKSSSAEQPRDRKINHCDHSSTVKDKDEG